MLVQSDYTQSSHFHSLILFFYCSFFAYLMISIYYSIISHLWRLCIIKYDKNNLRFGHVLLSHVVFSTCQNCVLTLPAASKKNAWKLCNLNITVQGLQEATWRFCLIRLKTSFLQAKMCVVTNTSYLLAIWITLR